MTGYSMQQPIIKDDYKFGFSKPETDVFRTPKGLSPKVVDAISGFKQEPVWMRDFRLKSLQIFDAKVMPTWGANLSVINFDDIYYYVSPTDKKVKSWDDVPADIKDTYDKIGIPEAEKKFLAGVGAQYDSEVVYHNLQQQWEAQGVVFVDTDTALKKYPDIFKQYFGTVIPPADNKFAALNSAVWSGGSFVYVPAGVHVTIPLQAYFRINAANMGQFERTLIIAEEGSYVHYVEGCTAPIYTTDSLHSAVVEIIVKKGARVRYTTIQNWSNNVYNLVTKRAFVDEEGVMEWVDGNIGCLTENAFLYTNPKGPVSIKDVKPGDWIYTTDLNSLKAVKSKVNAVVNHGKKEVFKLVTTNFREVEATASHPFLVLRKYSKIGLQTIRWEKLENLKIGDWVAIVNDIPNAGQPYVIDFHFNPKGHKRIPTIPKSSTNDLMWLLGLYLGDGFIERAASGAPRRVYFAIPPSDRARARLVTVVQDIFRTSYAEKGICLTINSSILANFILKLGFDGTAKSKRIPTWIYALPREQILSFIEGYFDADGYLRKNFVKDGEQYGQIVFASSNKKLLEELKMLMIAVGLEPLKISAYIKERKLYKDKLKEYTSYYLSMNTRGNLKKIRDKTGFNPMIRFVRVKLIEPIGKQKVYDIEVDQAHNFIANGIIVHNSKITMKYPSIYLKGKGAKGEVLSLAFAGKGQYQDAGGKAIHLAPYTTSTITSKSVSVNGGRTSYRGLININHGAKGSKSFVRCDALLLDELSRTDTYPTNNVNEEDVTLGHEASVSKIGEAQLFYLMSRGLSEAQATSLIVNGFIEPIVKELPLEYAVELNRLIDLSMEGAVG